ncbi:MAG: hypothetical protein KDA98_10030 [Acidimicrobiales bacterium]|nr:hypothetical protein [Acidimicrobiales bacterium]
MSARRVRRALGRALPPAIVAGSLWLLDRPRGAAVVGTIAVALAVLGTVAPATAERLDRGVAALARGAASGVSRVLAVLAWTFVLLPTWAIAQVWARVRPRARRGPYPSGWQVAAPGAGRHPDGSPSDARRTGSVDHAVVQRSPVPAILAILALTALLAAAMVVVGRRLGVDERLTSAEAGSTAGVPGEDGQAIEWNGLPVDDYAHEDEPWAKDWFSEMYQLRVERDFFLGHRLLDFEGRYLNVVDGKRVSYTPDDPELTVWFFGGSTMFGLGQRDEHTLPSVVAKAAEANGIRIRPVNFGVSGYVNWQSLEQFEQALSAGVEPPDLAVFYDGVNEWGMTEDRLALGDARLGSVSRFPADDVERSWIQDSPDNVGPVEWPEVGELAVAMSAEQYRRGCAVIAALAESYGVPIDFAWQPSPFAKKPHPADEGLWERLDFDVDWLPDSTERYTSILSRSGVEAIDLTMALDEVDAPVYFDGAHTNELGAQVIGEALYEQLRPQLEQLAR